MELHQNTDPGTSARTNIDDTEKLDIPQTNSVTEHQEQEMPTAIPGIISDSSDNEDEQMSTPTRTDPDTQPLDEDIDFRTYPIVLPKLTIPYTLSIEEMFQPDGGCQPVPVLLNDIISNLPLEAVLQETTEPLEPSGPPIPLPLGLRLIPT